MERSNSTIAESRTSELERVTVLKDADGVKRDFYLDGVGLKYVSKEPVNLDNVLNNEADLTRLELYYLRRGLGQLMVTTTYYLTPLEENRDQYALEGPYVTLETSTVDSNEFAGYLSGGKETLIENVAANLAKARVNKVRGTNILNSCNANLISAGSNFLQGDMLKAVLDGKGNCLDHMAILKVFVYSQFPNPEAKILKYESRDGAAPHYGLLWSHADKEELVVTNYSGITVPLSLLNLVFDYRNRNKNIQEADLGQKLEKYGLKIDQNLTADSMTLTEAFKLYVIQVLGFSVAEQQEVWEVIHSQFRALRIAAMKLDKRNLSS